MSEVVFLQRGPTIFLRGTILLIGITVLALSVFLLPWLANYTAEMYPEFSFLKFPVLVGLYLTAIPFFFALFQALRLLKQIEMNNIFSVLSVKALKQIKLSAITISILYGIGCIYMVTQSALHPSIAIIGFIIIFASLVVAVFAAVIEKLLKRAVDFKSENELTV